MGVRAEGRALVDRGVTFAAIGTRSVRGSRPTATGDTAPEIDEYV